jgi:hypothetical protein
MASIKTIVRRAWGALGPGLTTGAADDDPSGIATYSQAGAQFGYALTWSMLLTLPFMAASVGTRGADLRQISLPRCRDGCFSCSWRFWSSRTPSISLPILQPWAR